MAVNNIKELSKVTERLAGENNALARLKEFLEIETRFILLSELSDRETVENFLNTLFKTHGEYGTFIKTYPLFYLLKSGTFSSELPLRFKSQNEISSALQRLLDCAREIAAQNTEAEASPISNGAIVSRLEKFLTELPTVLSHDLDRLLLQDLDILQTFRFVQEIVYSGFFDYWSQPPDIDLGSLLNPTSALEKFFILHFSYENHLRTGNEGGLVEELRASARELLTGMSDAFIPVDGSSATFLTLPVSKQRTGDVLRFAEIDPPWYTGGDSANDRPQGHQTWPIFSFNEEILTTVRAEHLFFYDFIIDALSRGETYGCSTTVVDAFFQKTSAFIIHEIGGFLGLLKVRRREEIRTLDMIRRKMTEWGLTEKSCTVYRTIILLASPPGEIPWPHYGEFMQLLSEIVTFGNIFYHLLPDVSPTGISRNILKRKTSEALTRLSAASRTGGAYVDTSDYLRPFLTPIFKCFTVHPPVKVLVRALNEIRSSVVRTNELAIIRRVWGAETTERLKKKLTATEPPSVTKGTPKVKISSKQVEAYCRGLEVGTTMTHDENMTRSKYFAKHFTSLQIRPALLAILNNSLTKSRALFTLRWLVTFAAADSPSLLQIREKLTDLYFFIKDITEESSPEQIYFSSLIDVVWDLYGEIRQGGGGDGQHPDAAEVPTALLESLFTKQYGHLAPSLWAPLHKFKEDSHSILEGLLQLIDLGAVLCHRRFEYELETGVIKIETLHRENAVIRLSVSEFQLLITNLEKTTQEGCAMLNQMGQEVQQAYITLLEILNQVDALNAHPIKLTNKSPDFPLIRTQFLTLFEKLNKLREAISKSCSYSLTRRFSELFLPKHIGPKTVKEILAADGREDLKRLTRAVTDAVPERGEVAADSAEGRQPLISLPLNESQTEQLLELIHITTTTQRDPPIKLSYSSRLNSHRPLEIDWTEYARSEYLAEDDELNFTVFSGSELLDLLFSSS